MRLSDGEIGPIHSEVQAPAIVHCSAAAVRGLIKVEAQMPFGFWLAKRLKVDDPPGAAY